MENKTFCQSCGMPMEKPEDFGNNADQSQNREYCCYCYQKGAFTWPEAKMEDMINLNLKFNEENGFPFGNQEEARKQMEGWMPQLARWRDQR